MKKERYLYLQVLEDLKKRIQQKEFIKGDCLPKSEELAEQYGVSVITITHALNDLKEEGYITRIKGKGSFVKYPLKEEQDMSTTSCENSESSQELSGKQKKIGVVLEHVSSCFGLDLLYALDRCANANGYKLLVRFSYGDRNREIEELQFLVQEQVDGMIVMPCHGKYYNVELLKMIVDGIPVVLLDKKMDRIPVSSVRTDNAEAMEQLVTYLVKKQRKKIGFVYEDAQGTSSVLERKKGFENAVKKHGLEIVPFCCFQHKENIREIFTDEYLEEGTKRLEAYIDAYPELDGIVCSEYGIARYFGPIQKKLEERNLLVTCIDEDYLSSRVKRFPHVRQDERGIAEKAVSLLLQQIEHSEKYHQGNYLVKGIFREYNKK